jgi:uncharacterized repeat protein (TIGR02543 family)
MNRKATVLLTGTLTVSMLLGVAATANASGVISAINPDTSVSRSAASRIQAPTGTWFTVDGETIEDFDPTDGWDDPDTDYADSATYTVYGGSVEIHDVPEGWTVDCDMRVNGLTGEWGAFYILKNGTETYRWYFDGASDIIHTVDELRGFTLTLNGEAVDCDPTKDVEVHEVNPSDLVGYEGQPSTWAVLQGEFTENGVTGYQYVIHPDNAKTPSVTYRFFYDAPDPVDELAGVTATLDDGSPVTGFDPLNEEDIFTIPPGHTVTLGNLPDGWTQTSAGNDRRTAVTLTKTDGGSITYLFDISDDYQWTYVITQLANVTAELADGTPVEGFGYRGGEWTLPQDATGVNLKNIPEGWNVNCVNEPTGSLPTEKYWLYNVSSPDGKISVTYRFTIPHIYTVDELAGVTATADGNPVEGFTPTQTGTWTVPHGSTVLLTGIPEGWVTTHEDNTLVWTVTAPDNSVSVTWTFEQEQPASSTDDLKGVTATVDGIPVDNFDPTQSGTWLVPSGSTVSLSGIPSDWQVTHEKGTLVWTLTSPDGSLSVTWTFEEEQPAPSKDDLKTVAATVNGTPVEGFDPVNGGTFPVPAGTTSVDLDGIPEGWNATPMQDGLGFTMTSEDGSITVEYVFQPETIIHTVTFDYGIEGMTGSQQVTDGGKATEPVAPVRDGYRFDGWLLDCQPYDFATPVTGDITLTAGWTINTYTVRFDTAGGSSVPEQAIDHGQKITEPAAPTREGYTFTGWLLDGRPFDFSTPITGNLTLTAGWQENEPPAPVTHTVTFDSAGGSTIPAQTVTDGAAAIDPGTPTRDGYTFTGWLLDGKSFDFATPITGDITLTAGWEESGEPAPTIHTVTFDDGTGNTVTVNVQEGETVQEPSAPSRDGYEFTGWLLDGTPYDFTTPVTGDITLTAGWEKTEEPVTTFTVSFRTNGGTAVEQQTITEGGTVEKPMDPTRDGYTFTGWLLDGQPYDFTTPITGNIVLDAAWEQNTPIDELAGVTATVDGKPVEGFDPAKDGEYRIDEGAKVELNGVPEGWTVIRQETEDGYMFTLTNGERTVAYTFAATQGQETDTPGEPDGSTPADSGDTKTDVPGDEDRKDGLADTGASIGIVVSVLASAACLGAGIHLFRRTHRDRR